MTHLRRNSLADFSPTGALRPGKRALVTGGAGFIGSHLVETLLALGLRVTAVDDVSTGSEANVAVVRGNPLFQFVRGSAGDAPLMEPLLDEADVVFHLAAAVGVALIARAPLETIERNIRPTEQILNYLCRRLTERGEACPFFLASTSEVYGKNPKSVWNEEDDLVLGPTSKARWSYGASKAIDEFLALACAREYGLPVVIGRFFNVVGPRQTGAYGMVLPRFVQAALSGGVLQVHDDGRQERCFAHVSDVVGAVVNLMQTEAALGRVFNIGGDRPVSMMRLAEMVVEIAARRGAGQGAAIETISYAEAYSPDFEDVRRRVPDLSRLRETIAYAPRYDLEAMIEELVELGLKK